MTGRDRSHTRVGARSIWSVSYFESLSKGKIYVIRYSSLSSTFCFFNYWCFSCSFRNTTLQINFRSHLWWLLSFAPASNQGRRSSVWSLFHRLLETLFSFVCFTGANFIGCCQLAHTMGSSQLCWLLAAYKRGSCWPQAFLFSFLLYERFHNIFINSSSRFISLFWFFSRPSYWN